MKIFTNLYRIDNDHMAQTRIRRSYLRNRARTQGLFDALFKRHVLSELEAAA